MATATEQTVITIKAQPGPQDIFQASPADITILGGARGGGKTYITLVEPMRHTEKPAFRAAFFRRTFKQITAPNGPWDTAAQLYPYAGAEARGDEWVFPSGAKVVFRHMENSNDWQAWLGSQVPLLLFDQLEAFESEQFFAMLACNRDPTGTVKPYVRATCNPEPGWLADFIQWWWDEKTGYPIKERAGVLRWFVRTGDSIRWADTAEELQAAFPGTIAKSVTFIPAFLTDNKILMERDPSYLSSLMAQSAVNRERWINGNWKIKPRAGDILQSSKLRMVDFGEVPKLSKLVRRWDLAFSDTKGADFLAGAKMGRTLDGRVFIVHVKQLGGKWTNTSPTIPLLADTDGPDCTVLIEANGTQLGYYQEMKERITNRVVEPDKPEGSKEMRASVWGTRLADGIIYCVRGDWNAALFDQMDNFPSASTHDDMIDAISGGWAFLNKPTGAFSNETLAALKSDVPVSNVAQFERLDFGSVEWMGAMSKPEPVKCKVCGTIGHELCVECRERRALIALALNRGWIRASVEPACPQSLRSKRRMLGY